MQVAFTLSDVPYAAYIQPTLATWQSNTWKMQRGMCILKTWTQNLLMVAFEMDTLAVEAWTRGCLILDDESIYSIYSVQY